MLSVRKMIGGLVPGCTSAAATLALMLLPGQVHAADAVCGVNATECNEFINTYVNPIINTLAALVGVIAVISIITAGIQYASSADDPAAVSKAKKRFFNTIVGLLAYIFLFAFLNYLIPGGLF